MKSLPTIEQLNLKKYWSIIRKLEPEFFLIRVALKETGVNPLVIPRVVRAIANLAVGEGYGKISIFMEGKKITTIEGIERDLINEEAVEEKA
jgi:hypothetical protein